MEEDNKYKELLVNQLDWCNKMENRDNIYRKAEKLYKEILNKKEQSRFWNRCCKYKELLVNQLDWCNKMENRDNIYRKAEKLYKEILNKKEQSRFWNRCCDFSLLEEKAIEFISLEVNID